MRKKASNLLFGLVGSFAALNLSFCPQADAQAASTVQSRLYECGDATTRYVETDTHTHSLVSQIVSRPGEGYSQSQAGIFIEGIAGGVPVTTTLSYKVKPLLGGKASINCSQGPILRDDGTINGVPFKALNTPVGASNGTLTGPDADGFYTVSYDLTTQVNVVFNNLGLFATNGGAYRIKDFALDGRIVGLDLKHPLLCPFGTSLSGFAPNQYCGN